MPIARICSAPGCGRTSTTYYCPDCKAKVEASQAITHKQSANQAEARRLRNSGAWNRYRKWYKAQNPYCKDPFGIHRDNGCQVPMVDIHHIPPVAKRPALLLEPSNTMALCRTCHNQLDRLEQAARRDVEDAIPLATLHI